MSVLPVWAKCTTATLRQHQHRNATVLLARLLTSKSPIAGITRIPQSLASTSSSRLTVVSSSSFSCNCRCLSSWTHSNVAGLNAELDHSDPEVAGFKDRLIVERRIYTALSTISKIRDQASFQAASIPRDDEIARQVLGHSDPLSNLRFSDLNLDSLDRIEALVSIENEFNHEFSDADYEKFNQIGDIIEELLWIPRAGMPPNKVIIN